VGEDRTRSELEVPVLLVVDRKTGDVGRLEVGRALDARGCGALDRLRNRAGEHRLGGAGDVLEQDVAARDQGCDDQLDLLALAVDDRLDVVEEPFRQGRAPRETIGLLYAS